LPSVVETDKKLGGVCETPHPGPGVVMPSLQRGIRALIFSVLALGVPFVAVAQAQPYVYAITGNGVFRGGSLTLSGCGTSTGVAVRNDGLRVYVSCAQAGGALLVIDRVAKQIIAVDRARCRTACTPSPGSCATTPATREGSAAGTSR